VLIIVEGGGDMKKRLFKALVVLTGMFLLSASIVWAQPAPLAKTGQATCYDVDGTSVISCPNWGQDAELQKGVAWPSPRFIDHGDDTVTDKLTGLMWDKTPYGNSGGKTFIWRNAVIIGDAMIAGTNCGRGHEDWRLPNVNEMLSLVNYDRGPWAYFMLPYDHPFEITDSVEKGAKFWTSTTAAMRMGPELSFAVDMQYGTLERGVRTDNETYHLWIVRDAN
jgi:hypothetical protein